MWKTLGGVLITFLLSFISVEKSYSYAEFLAHSADPAASRLIKISFFVDNQSRLEKPYLEVRVIEDGHNKRLVSLQSNHSAVLAGAVSDMTVPEGDVHLSVCGYVKCSADQEPALVCGQTVLPETIMPGSEHEITFSTDGACQDSTGLLAKAR